MVFHRHRWRFKEHGTGEYRKGEQQLEIATPGFSADCMCGKKMFFPDDPKLRPVEVADNGSC